MPFCKSIKILSLAIFLSPFFTIVKNTLCQTVILKYNLTTDSLPSNWDQNIIPGNFSKGSFITSLTFSSSGSTGKPWPVGELNPNAYFQIWLKPATGYQIKITALRFSERRSLTGIHHYTVKHGKGTGFLQGSTISDVEVPDNDLERPGDITGLNIKIKPNDTLIFRWYGYLAESSAGTWRINDNSLIVEGIVEPLFNNDTSGYISFTLQQPPSQPISSLADNSGFAAEWLRFAVTDGNITDTLPTIITALNFKNKIQPQFSNWTQNIGGIIIKCGQEITGISAVMITDSYIMVTPALNAMYINQGQTKQFSVWVYLKNSGLIDKNQLQCFIDSVDHGFGFSTEGSGLMEHFPHQVISSSLQIDVVATELNFVIPNLHTIINEPFTASVFATDNHKNTDLDINNIIRLKSVSKIGQVQSASGLIKNFSQGKITWSDLIFNQSVPFQLQAYSEGFDTLISMVLNAQHIFLSDNFETGILSQWNDTTDWTCSEQNPINGARSLKHNLVNTEGKSIITIPLSYNKFNEGITHWQVKVKNGNWDPSATSRWRFWLMAEKNTTDTIMATGIAVGINYSSSDDLLTLYEIKRGVAIPLIISELDWNANTQANIAISHYPDGKWTLQFDTTSTLSNMVYAGENIKKIDFQPVVTGFEFEFSKSRAGLLWIDDFSTGSTNTGPYLTELEVEKDSLFITFSEPVVPSSLLESDAIKIENQLGNIVQTGNPVICADSVHVKIPLLQITNGLFILKLKGIKDKTGMFNEMSEHQFRYSLRARMGLVVISEIMADPTPPVGLPEADFLEITNISPFELNLEGMRLKTGSKNYFFPKIYLPSNQQLIICNSGFVDEFIPFGLTLPLIGTNDLLASGTHVALYSFRGLLIDEYTYSTKSYRNTTKSQGGWTIEKINLQNICLADSNWTASDDPLGGTPGRINSVDQSNLHIPLKIVNVTISSPKDLIITLNEKPDTINFTNTNNFIIEPGAIEPSSVATLDQSYLNLLLHFNENFVENQLYHIYLTSQINNCMGISLQSDKGYKFGISTTPSSGDLIINEILFNPLPGGCDFVEIFNVSQKLIDLSQLQLFSGSLEAGTATLRKFSKFPALMQPNDYYVITTDSNYLQNTYPNCQSAKYLILSSLPSFPDKSGNAGICDTTGNKIDEMYYSETMHYQMLPSFEGVSLEKINPLLPSGNSSSWHSAAATAGYATPGCPNSQFNKQPVDNDFVVITPEIFSPDNDGYSDRLFITINPDKQGYTGYITFFNSRGIEVNRIAAGLLAPGENLFSWDGTDKNGRELNTGVYIVYTELVNINGSVKKIKKTCVLAKRLN